MNSIESNPKRSEKRSKDHISGESSDFKLWNKAFGQEEFKVKNEERATIEGFNLSGMPHLRAQNNQFASIKESLSNHKKQVKSQIENVQIDKPRNSQSRKAGNSSQVQIDLDDHFGPQKQHFGLVCGFAAHFSQ